MNKKIINLASSFASSDENFKTIWKFYDEELEVFSQSLIEEVIKIITKTRTNCANTTYDLGIVECTINEVVNNIKNNFNSD